VFVAMVTGEGSAT